MYGNICRTCTARAEKRRKLRQNIGGLKERMEKIAKRLDTEYEMKTDRQEYLDLELMLDEMEDRLSDEINKCNSYFNAFTNS